jgi:hypothetical protein
MIVRASHVVAVVAADTYQTAPAQPRPAKYQMPDQMPDAWGWCWTRMLWKPTCCASAVSNAALHTVHFMHRHWALLLCKICFFALSNASKQHVQQI